MSKQQLVEQVPHIAEGSWVKSTRSGPVSDNCVELAPIAGGVAIRDSKGTGAVQAFTGDEFQAFIDGVKAGEFDHLV